MSGFMYITLSATDKQILLVSQNFEKREEFLDELHKETQLKLQAFEWLSLVRYKSPCLPSGITRKTITLLYVCVVPISFAS